MTMGRILVTCLLGCLAVVQPAAAQSALNEGQGHPLKGTWIGDWGAAGGKRTPVLIEMDWDGKAVTASLNPGPEAVRFAKAELNHNNWTVHLETSAGGVNYVIDGQIENLGSANRWITGTWSQGSQKGNFKITRQ